MNQHNTLIVQGDHHAIPLTRSAVGHLIATATIGGKAFDMILDTGASSTIVAIDRARKNGLSMTKLSITAGGVGTSNAEVHQLSSITIALQDLPIPKLNLLAMDISHVNESLAERGASLVDGIIGADLLDQHDAVLDYRSYTLYLRE